VEIGGAPSHVAFTPDGRRALAVMQDADKVALLEVNSDTVHHARDLPTGDGPYNVEVTPDGRFAVTSDRGMLTVIDLKAEPPQVLQTVKVEQGSEGLAISPRGDLAVSVALRGSNAPPSSSVYHEHGAMAVLRIDPSGLTPLKTIELGRVPEGVSFTPEGSHLYVANFYDNDVWIFRVNGTELADTGKRLALPGRPASARATPAALGAR
jgi:DNA-binding beta-propeller fold protein YncE